MVAAQERDHVEPPGRGIDRWSTRDTGDRGDVSAWEGTGVHRLTKVLGPDRLSRKDVERVDGVVFGRDDDVAGHDQRGRVDRGVNRHIPCDTRPRQRGFRRSDPRSPGVAVVFGPFSGDRRRRCRRRARSRCRRRIRAGAAGNQDETQGEKTRGLANQRPQANLRTGFRRARSGAINET